MNDDLISREAALDAIDRIRLEVWLIDIPSPTVPEYIEHHEGIQHVLGEIDALRKKVEQLPGIDEQKTGKWIIKAVDTFDLAYGGTGYEPVYECSACGRVTESYLRLDEPKMPEDADFPKYCPWCGAKMEGGTDDEG